MQRIVPQAHMNCEYSGWIRCVSFAYQSL